MTGVAALVVLGAALAADASQRADAHLTSWLELDTNAKRIPTGSLDEDGSINPNKPADDVVGDGLVRMEGSFSAQARDDGFVLRHDTAGGLKLFFTQDTERMAVAQSRTSLQSQLPLGFTSTLAALAKVRGQTSGARSYTLVRGDGLLEHALPARLSARGGLSAQVFHAFDNALFTSTQGSLVGGARAQLTAAERVDLLVDVGQRMFPFASRDPSNRAIEERRIDVVSAGTLAVSSARMVFLAGSYTLVRNASNARAESFTRHRLSAVVGFRLPEQITCSAQGTVQLTSYDDGVSLGQRYFLGDDEESQNVLEVQLTRPLFGGLSIEARASFMGNELAVEGARFARQTAAIGLRAEL